MAWASKARSATSRHTPDLALNLPQGPADAYSITDITDPFALPAACVQQRASKQWSVVALNVNHTAIHVTIQLPTAAASIKLFRLTYTYGDLATGKVSNCVMPQPAAGAAGQVTVSAGGVLQDTLPPLTLAVFTEYM